MPGSLQSVLRILFALRGTLGETGYTHWPPFFTCTQAYPMQKPLFFPGPRPRPSSILPALLSPISLLSPQGPKSRPDSAAPWLSRAKGWCPDNRTLQPYLCPSPRPWPWWACPCPSALCLGFLASFWQSQHPFLPATPSLPPGELPRAGRRAEP